MSLLQAVCLQTSKTVTIKYKPVTSLAGNNTLTHYKKSRGYDQISHALSNIHGLYGCSGNLLDITSIYSYQAVSPTNGLGTMLGVVGSGLSVIICQGIRLMDTPQWTMLAPQREHYNPTETNVFTTLLTLQEEKRSTPTATPGTSPITLTLNHLANKAQQTTHTLFGLMYQVRDGLLYL